MIVIGGAMGLGKSTVAKLLGEHFNSDVFYESVDDNPILPLFYTASEEEIQAKRYPFLLQLYFLKTRFQSIKKASNNDKNILDRSIYEDAYFCKKNVDLGRISELEYDIYIGLLNEMMEEINEIQKRPRLMIYLKGSFETMINRIKLRGREYELDDELLDYYFHIWCDYDNWIFHEYKESEIIVIDMDNIDIVNNKEDREKVIQMVEEKLKTL